MLICNILKYVYPFIKNIFKYVFFVIIFFLKYVFTLILASWCETTQLMWMSLQWLLIISRRMVVLTGEN